VTNHVSRLGREVRELSEDPPDPAPLPPAEPDADAHQLAREAAQAFADQLARFRTAKARDKPSDPAVAPDDWDLRLIRQQAPEDFTFFDIERLARHDPAEAAARWEEVKAAARRDLDSGWLAGRALEYQGGSAWDRACFLAVRDRLRRAWQPRTDVEALLLDEIAQYELVRREWVRILSYLSRHPRTVIGYQTNGEYVRDRDHRTIGAVQATAEAARMVERMQRLQQAAVRTLLNLRRTRATVTVRNTGPVNVALGPQVNVAGPRPPADEPGPVVVRTEASP
jgi:hypothetical protein